MRLFHPKTLKGLLVLGALLCFLNGFSQDSITSVESTPEKKILFAEKDIKIDTDSIGSINFAPEFKSKYNTDEFVYEEKLREKNVFERFLQWLSDGLAKLFKMSNPEASMNLLLGILKIIAVIIILIVIFLIVKSIMNKEGQWVFGKNSDRKMIRYDEIEKNLHRVDFEKLISEAIASGEKRLSIRYYYLWLLKRMSEREIIQWDTEKTNSDYLYEISDEKLKNNFGYLSYLYNYIWYGEFEIDDETFEKATLTFQKTIQSL